MEEENLTLDESSRPETRGSFADRLIDDLLPEDVDWRNLVSTYPVSVLSLAAIGGFLLARHKGLAMLGALSGFVADEVTDQIASFRSDG